MPRKAFLADVQEAQQSSDAYGVTLVMKGLEDGDFNFSVVLPDHTEVKVSAIVTDVSDYPKWHEFHVFGDDDAPERVAASLSRLGSTAGKTVKQLVQMVSLALHKASTSTNTNTDATEDLDYEMTDVDSEGGGVYSHEDEDEDMIFDGPETQASTVGIQEMRALRERVPMDLLKVKQAGFKYSCHGNVLGGDECYVGVSCRAIKLGISVEAMRAWDIKENDYIMLQLHFRHGYRNLDELCDKRAASVRDLLTMRVGKCKAYKPAFSTAFRRRFNDDSERQFHKDAVLETSDDKFQDLLISKPLNALLAERLIYLIRCRLDQKMTWSGAENFYRQGQGQGIDVGSVNSITADMELETRPRSFPYRVTNDHLASDRTGKLSFPLIAMQFFLRHYVRCTEFCLVCHRQMTLEFEALKPYVCDNPLCLYQYMNLGFGPSIDTEILNQPFVVDLLVSFCHIAAANDRLKDRPLGMDLKVPGHLSEPNKRPSFDWARPKSTLKFNAFTGAIEFLPHIESCPVQEGDWVTIVVAVPGKLGTDRYTFHTRIGKVAAFPVIELGERLATHPTPIDITIVDPKMLDNHALEGTFYPYVVNFDEMVPDLQRRIICELLETLPKVQDMKTYLTNHPNETIGRWKSHVSPPALGLLRWIIASCRSCIIQVDNEVVDDGTGLTTQGHSAREARLGGMDQWLQFRFAMGAPDKEEQFLKQVRQQTRELGLKFPTFFAWHGSHVANWHHIIREGLCFDYVANGRAYGDGVYLSLSAHVSMAYARSSRTKCHGLPPRQTWPNSKLSVNTCLSLNEVVNAPRKFRSRSPHFVVQQLGWIQTRYLFVEAPPGFKTTVDPALTAGSQLSSTGNLPVARTQILCHEQDPKMRPVGVGSNSVTIPLSAMPSSTRLTLTKSTANGEEAQGYIDDDSKFDDGKSDITLPGDRAITASGSSNFVPCSLDKHKLPIIDQPKWATPTATRRLQKELQNILKVQASQPLAELGWYIDDRFVDNLYQWIVELHSFDPELSVAKDMVKEKVNSIVLEIRFGQDYPISPPFVRVMSPRFLPFHLGGGGHVTSGGAICTELLTTSAWNPVCSIENVIQTVRFVLMSQDPRPARLATNARDSTYGNAEATQAFIRACKAHGWEIPRDFEDLAKAGDALPTFRDV